MKLCECHYLFINKCKLVRGVSGCLCATKTVSEEEREESLLEETMSLRGEAKEA